MGYLVDMLKKAEAYDSNSGQVISQGAPPTPAQMARRNITDSATQGMRSMMKGNIPGVGAGVVGNAIRNPWGNINNFRAGFIDRVSQGVGNMAGSVTNAVQNFPKTPAGIALKGFQSKLTR